MPGKIETLVVHGGQRPDPATGAITTPIHLATVGAYGDLDEQILLGYGRDENPTRESLEKLCAELEDGGFGFAFSSGMAAISSFFATLSKGSHVVLGNQLYGGTIRLAGFFLSKYLKVSYADPNDIGSLEAAVKPNTAYIFVETITNPLLDVIDLEALQKFSEAKGIPFVLDNTFATPYLLQGFNFGAKAIIYSTSKYLAGHNDVLGGIVVTKDPTLAKELAFYQKTLGAVPGPYDVYNTIRGMQTLVLRMERQCENAQKIAEFLEGRVQRVYYPGLLSHSGHETATRQMPLGYGGVVSFEIAGDYKRFAQFLASQEPPIIYLAKSLGGVQSLLSHPATMSHANLTPEERASIGIKDNLFRLSVGIEHVDDLIGSLDTALLEIGK